MLRKLFSTWPHGLRALAMAMAALSVAWGIALPSGIVAAVAGAALGVVAGQLLGRSKLRLWVALGGLALLVVAVYQLASFAVGSPLLPGRFGPGAVLRVASVLRFGGATFGVASALRVLAVRRPVAVGLELCLVAFTVPLTFAAHRDGIIARPLWLSDWAWQRGIDPKEIFLAMGGGAVFVLALLLLAEGRSHRALSAFLTLGLLTAVAIALLRFIGMPTPDLDSLGLDGGSADAGGSGKPDAGDAGDGGGSRGRRGLDGGGAEDDDDGGTYSFLDGGLGDGSDDDGGGRLEVPPDLDKVSGGGKDAPMAIVLLEDDYSPPSQGYYLREDALSQFNGSRLVHATRGDADLDVPQAFPREATAVSAPPPAAGHALVHTTVVLLVEHPQPFGLESPSLLAPLPNPNPARFKRAYRVESLAQSLPYKELFGRPAGDPAWPAELRAHYLEGPEDPRYAAMARAIVAALPAKRRTDPFSMAVGVKLKLDDAFIYSTKHKHDGVADPTADFLFGDRTGYCVHFAHAAVYLWRALGIPARIGTGYRPDEDSRHGGSAILVRGNEAHAWPELYLEGYGWVILDIAPKTNLDPPSSAVDNDLQRLLGEMARKLPPDPEDTGKSRLPLPLLRDLALGMGFSVALAFAVLHAAKLWRRLAPHVAGRGALPKVGYRSMLDMLAEVGLCRRFGESREAFARRVGRVAPSFEAATGLHLAAALGPPDRDRAAHRAFDRAAWREGLRAVRAEIRAGKPLARRLLGALNPASFFGSR